MNRRNFVGFILVLFTLTALGVGAWIVYVSRPLPITKLDEVYYSPAESWIDFYTLKRATGTGWVHLHTNTVSSVFESQIDIRRNGVIKPAVCGECHEEQYRSLLSTAHYLTSQEATHQSVLGSFEAGENVLTTRESGFRFEMNSTPEGFFQCLKVQRKGKSYQHCEPIDIVTGSGNHGQSYLYWKGDGLYELPVSYFSESQSWVNSPGLYQDGTADFARSIGDRCLDCHCTFFAKAPNTFNEYDRANYVLGVTCVRCHGPGWAHVQFHQHHPDESEPRYIVNPGKLERDRANEVCAQCHSGAGELVQLAFSYRPGEPLSEYLILKSSDDNAHNDDPHAANQLDRLKKSECYRKSERMTCATCHNPHQNERGNLKVFAQRCLSCHQIENCKLSPVHGQKIVDRCIQCHMPSRRDKEGSMQTPDGELLPLLRDHFVKVWPDISRQIVEEMKDDRAPE